MTQKFRTEGELIGALNSGKVLQTTSGKSLFKTHNGLFHHGIRGTFRLEAALFLHVPLTEVTTIKA